MYYPFFTAYMLIGFVLSFLVLFWALQNGQFKDQNRARFLPLQDERQGCARHTSKVSRIEIYTLVFLASAGLMASAAVLVFSLVRAG